MFFDTHAHIDDRRFSKDFKKLAEEYKKDNIVGVMIPGVSAKDWDIIKEMSKQDIFYAGYGIHPQEVDKHSDKDLQRLEEIIKINDLVCVGEIGLDLYWRQDNLERQKYFFIEQIKLARKYKLPINIHDREAHGAIKDILFKYADFESGVIMHCYSGSVELAKEYIKKGAYISFAGPVTFKNARVPKEVVKIVPLDRLLIETDSPYLTPEPFRGKRNSPSNVRFIASKIAELKSMELKDIAIITTNNAKRVFSI